MTEYEALLILGLENNKMVTQAEINKSYIKKIGINHPDRSIVIRWIKICNGKDC